MFECYTHAHKMIIRRFVNTPKVVKSFTRISIISWGLSRLAPSPAKLKEVLFPNDQQILVENML
jgi:hypothetical protein